MKKVWSKFKFSIILLGYATLVVAWVYFFMIPLVNSIKALSYQVQAKAIDREIERAQIEKLPEMMSEWSEYENRSEMLNVILSQQDQVSFIENLESIAQISGNKVELKIEDGSETTSARGKDASRKYAYPDYLSLNINLEGDYNGLVKFIHLLENCRFYVNILAISAGKNSSEADGNSNPFGNSVGTSENEEKDVQRDYIRTNISAIVYIKK